MPLSIVQRLFLKPVSYGALTQLWGATMPEAETYNGAVSLSILTIFVPL